MHVGQYRQYLDMMNQWLIIKQEGKSIEHYLKRNGYGTIAIYGMAVYGRHVVRELYGGDIKIAYGIDRKKMSPYKGITIVSPMGELPTVDLIINTVIHEHAAIEKDLSKIIDCQIVSLEDVVYESYE